MGVFGPSSHPTASSVGRLLHLAIPTCHPSSGFAGSPEDSVQRPHRLPQCFFGKSSCHLGLALKKRIHTGFGIYECPSISLAPPTPTLPISSPKNHKEPPCTSAPSAAPATGGGSHRGPSSFPHQPQHSHTVHRQGEVSLRREPGMAVRTCHPVSPHLPKPSSSFLHPTPRPTCSSSVRGSRARG